MFGDLVSALSLAASFAFAVLAFKLSDTPWAREQNWLIPFLWAGFTISLTIGLVRVIWKRRTMPERAGHQTRQTEQRTERGSPVTAGDLGDGATLRVGNETEQKTGLGSAVAVGDIGAGATVNIGGVLGATPAGSTPMQPNNAGPEIACRGKFSKVCSFAWLASEDLDVPQMDCLTLGFRNVGSELARHVIAHLDFYPESGDLTAVDEGWWVDDCEYNRRSSVPFFYIGKGETKYLVVAAASPIANQCVALEKTHRSGIPRPIPRPILLAPGRWKVKIELRCDGFRNVHYMSGVVRPDGLHQWSDVTDSPPSD